jgi:FMN-dependent NADH-azoreductase
MGRCRLHAGRGPHSAAEGTTSLSDSLHAELEQADEYAFGVPMHNFGVPSVLKLWIDQIVRVGRTFSYADGKPKGLIIDKKATFIIATGGIYDAQTQMASLNFVEPYLRSVFGFLGLTDATFLTAGGTMALNQGHDRHAFLAPHLQAVHTHARGLRGATAQRWLPSLLAICWG